MMTDDRPNNYTCPDCGEDGHETDTCIVADALREARIRLERYYLWHPDHSYKTFPDSGMAESAGNVPWEPKGE